MKRLLSIAMIALVVSLCACKTIPFKQKPAVPSDVQLEGNGDVRSVDTATPASDGLKLSSVQRFSDVPLPENVKEDFDRTFVYESADLQIARMVYTTRVNHTELAQFYIRECPVAGWTLDNDVQADIITLHFVKPDKSMQVTIRNLGFARGTELVILLVPQEPES